MACLSIWRRLAQSIVIPLGFFLVFAAGPAIADSSTMTPQATIQKVTGEVLAVLQANKKKSNSNPAKVRALITQIVDPYFDYKRMSEEAIGVAWRRADAQQRARFTQVFHKLLLIDYATAYKQYSGQTIKIMGTHWGGATHNRAMVLSKIYSSGEQPVRVDYRLYHTQDRWKIYDVMVEGISLLINYHETFAAELQRGTLDALILRLQQKVAADKSSVSS